MGGLAMSENWTPEYIAELRELMKNHITMPIVQPDYIAALDEIEHLQSANRKLDDELTATCAQKAELETQVNDLQELAMTQSNNLNNQSSIIYDLNNRAFNLFMALRWYANPENYTGKTNFELCGVAAKIVDENTVIRRPPVESK
jgi:hypothetical protein